jgi:hypothetical protein
MIAFEYQGEYHYGKHFLLGSPEGGVKTRDSSKKACCQDLGITLVEVPYWWKKDKGSLLATIHHIRPDLVPVKPTTAKISSHPPFIPIQKPR